MNLLQPMMIAALLVAGMGVALLGSLKVPLARRLQIDEAKVGGLVSLFGFVMMPIILIAGFITDSAGSGGGVGAGKPLVLCGGCVLMALSLVMLSRAKNYAVTFVAVIAFSAAWPVIINVANVLTQPAFGGISADPFSLGNVFFGLGAFLTPMSIAFLIRRWSLQIAILSLAGIVLVPVALAGLYVIPALSAADSQYRSTPADSPSFLIGQSIASQASAPIAGPLAPAGQTLVALRAHEGFDLLDLLSHPMLWLCGFALFFYGPLEASLAAWSTTYLGDQGVDESTAAKLLSGFWLAFMLSRLMTALLISQFFSSKAMILGLAFVSVVLLIGFVLCRSKKLAAALVLLAGLVFGPIFPSLIAVLLGTFPTMVHGRAVGFFFAVGGIGWTMVPMLIGLYAKRTSVQRGFVIAVGASVSLSGLALAILLQS